MRKRKRFGAGARPARRARRVCALLLLAVAARAQTARQTVTLKPGWNAVYVSVAPEGGSDELFADWPVASVSAYRASGLFGTEQPPGGLSGEYTAPEPFGIWTRETPSASTLRFLPADTVLVCFNTNSAGSAAFSRDLTGRPAAPRISWSASPPGAERYQYVGVRLAEGVAGVAPEAYFAGAGILPPVMRLGGLDEGRPVIYKQPGTQSFLADGEAVLVRTEKVTDWSGPLRVSPRRGVDFGKEGQTARVEIRNDGAAAKTVEVVYAPSASGGRRCPELLWKDESALFSTNRWAALGTDAPVVKALSTGEVWRIGLAVDRRQFGAADAGGVFGGILDIRERGGTRMLVQLPCAVAAGPVPAGAARASGTWPAGLWAGFAELTKVSRPTGDGDGADGLPAGGRMKLRLLIHVDDHGAARLLQRVSVATKRNGDGSFTRRLYGPGAQIPADFLPATRISCAALPTSLGAPGPAGGEFLGGPGAAPLVFRYTIGEDDPSNPFFHPLHPQFDGLLADFRTPAPSGADFKNYIGAVKPERFPVGGEIRLSFDSDASEPWDPSETAAGSIVWIYTGVRREGPLRADGTFSLTRISRTGTLDL